jgi:hypothetical protein
VGVALNQRDASAVVTRLDDAAAEAAAHLLGSQRGAPGAPKRDKSRASAATSARGKQTAKRADARAKRR